MTGEDSQVVQVNQSISQSGTFKDGADTSSGSHEVSIQDVSYTIS